eukprot:gnl/TRDRNA2_/TRDRNA2_169322_c5_seq1.p1 gnl/TRDRNA2_/TRDRNA2_169322_c5~~gnl/TRDRNA2_/TRDRNA2_169322_c5_seq1.p1  ORF type:complete len:275 (-),score=49.27 gnl/TRDRNA2_/TRDRNA2_169322_c5_seq1:20-844(-)
MCGMSLAQFESITKSPAFTPDMTMYWVVQKVVIPETNGTGMSYALKLNKKRPLWARYMVSHAWGELYTDFLAALRGWGTEGPFWVCATAIYQPEDIDGMKVGDQLGKDTMSGPFACVVKQAAKMVAINTPAVDIYTRMWCVLEMYVAVQHDVPVEIAFVPVTDKGGYGGAIREQSNPFEGQIDVVNSQEAGCSKQEDADKIKAEIALLPGGFKAINHAVEQVRYDALVKAEEDALRLYNEKTSFGLGAKYEAERGGIRQFYQELRAGMKERLQM